MKTKININEKNIIIIFTMIRILIDLVIETMKVITIQDIRYNVID